MWSEETRGCCKRTVFLSLPPVPGWTWASDRLCEGIAHISNVTKTTQAWQSKVPTHCCASMACTVFLSWMWAQPRWQQRQQPCSQQAPTGTRHAAEGWFCLLIHTDLCLWSGYSLGSDSISKVSQWLKWKGQCLCIDSRWRITSGRCSPFGPLATRWHLHIFQ